MPLDDGLFMEWGAKRSGDCASRSGSRSGELSINVCQWLHNGLWSRLSRSTFCRSRWWTQSLWAAWDALCLCVRRQQARAPAKSIPCRSIHAACPNSAEDPHWQTGRQEHHREDVFGACHLSVSDDEHIV